MNNKFVCEICKATFSKTTKEYYIVLPENSKHTLLQICELCLINELNVNSRDALHCSAAFVEQSYQDAMKKNQEFWENAEPMELRTYSYKDKE